MNKGRKAFVIAHDVTFLGKDDKYHKVTFHDLKTWEHEGNAIAFASDINKETQDAPYYVKQIWVED